MEVKDTETAFKCPVTPTTPRLPVLRSWVSIITVLLSHSTSIRSSALKVRPSWIVIIAPSGTVEAV
jgi:hypothetical protein